MNKKWKGQFSRNFLSLFLFKIKFILFQGGSFSEQWRFPFYKAWNLPHLSVYPFSNLYHILYKLVQTFQIKFYTPLCTTLHENKRFTSCAGFFFFLFICNSLWENSIGTAVHVSYQLVVSNNVTKYVTCRVSETNLKVMTSKPEGNFTIPFLQEFLKGMVTRFTIWIQKCILLDANSI